MQLGGGMASSSLLAHAICRSNVHFRVTSIDFTWVKQLFCSRTKFDINLPYERGKVNYLWEGAILTS